MKNICGRQGKALIISRINDLSSYSPAQWGKMSVNQMLCHVSDQIRMATGEIKTDFIGNPFLEVIMKQMILLGVPTPKGKVPTVKELNQEKLGTKPTGFEEDRKTLNNLIENFEQNYPEKEKLRHPAFGAMSRRQWGRLVYLHLDHHLRQFGK